MTVKELLIQIRPLLLTHEWVTHWSKGTPTELRIDVEHNHSFHAVGKFDMKDRFNSDYYITEPFTHAYYHGYEGSAESHEYCVLDFEVYRWKLEVDKVDDKLWNLVIETHQT